MRTWLLLIALAGCGAPATTTTPAPVANTAAPATAPAPAVTDPVHIATTFARAAIADDRATALSMMLSYEQVLSLSNKAADRSKEEWDGLVSELLDGYARIGRDTPNATITGGRITKSGTLTPGEDEKVLRPIDYAFVEVSVATGGPDGGSETTALVLLKVDGQWRFSPGM